MTTEELERHTNNAAAILAYVKGKPVECRVSGDGDAWDVVPAPLWDCRSFDYRPKPEPTTRPWSKPEDVPGPVCWIRYPGSDAASYIITSVHDRGVETTQDGFAFRHDWKEMPHREHSTDRKTWHKCEVIEG